MLNKGTIALWAIGAAAVWLGVAGNLAAAPAEQVATDIILVIDTSLSMPLGPNAANDPAVVQRFEQWMRNWPDLKSLAPQELDARIQKAIDLTRKNFLSDDWTKFEEAEFDRFKDEIAQFVENGLLPDATVTLITFGVGATRVGSTRIGDANQRKALLADLKKLTAKADRTHIHAGLKLAMDEVVALKAKQGDAGPRHHRHVVLITDGNDNPPNRAGFVAANVDKLIANQDQAGLRPGTDCSLWYAHFGPPAPDLVVAVAKLQGQTTEITKLRFGQFSLNRAVLELPDQQPPAVLPAGRWQQSLPTDRQWAAGERLSIDHRNCEGVTVQLGKVEWENLPTGATITFSCEPKELTLGPAHQKTDFRLTFAGSQVPPGEYKGRIRLSAPGGLIIPMLPYLEVTVKVLAAPPPPTITLSPQDKLDLGTATLTQAAEGQLFLQYNDVAKALRPPAALHFGIGFDGLSAVPAGLVLEVGFKGDKMHVLEPSSKFPNYRIIKDLSLSGNAPLLVRARIAGPYPLKPGVLRGHILAKSPTEGVLVLPGNEKPDVELHIEPVKLHLPEAPLSAQVVGGSARPAPAAPVRCEALTGDRAIKLTLGPPRLEPPAPSAAPEVKLEQTECTVSAQQPNLRLALSVAARQPGRWTFAVPVSSADPLVAVEPSEALLEVTVEPFHPKLDPKQSLRADFDLADAMKPIAVAMAPESLPQDRTLKLNLGTPKAETKDAPEMTLEQSAVEVSRQAPGFSLKGVIKSPAPGTWDYSIPLLSDDPLVVPDPAELTVRVTIRVTPKALALEETQFELSFDSDPSAAAEATAEIVLPFSAAALPEKGVVRLQLNGGKPTVAVPKGGDGKGPLLTLEQCDFSVARDNPKAKVQLKFTALREGRFQFNIPVASLDPRFRIEPGAIGVTVSLNAWVQAPAGFITEATRVWPFARKQLYTSSFRGPASQCRLEWGLALPGQPLETVAVEEVEGGAPGVLLKSPDVMSPLGPIALDDRSVRDAEVNFRLLCEGQEVATFSRKVQAVRNILEPPRFVREVDGRHEPVAIAGGSVQASLPLRLKMDSVIRFPTDARLAIKQRQVFVLTERPARTGNGRPADSFIRQALAMHDKESPDLQCFDLSLKEPVARAEVLNLPVPQRSWGQMFRDIVSGNWDQYCIVERVCYSTTAGTAPGGEAPIAQEWGNVVCVSTTPWYYPWLRRGFFGMLLAMAGFVAVAVAFAVRRAGVPPVGELLNGLGIRVLTPRFRFEPEPNPQGRNAFRERHGFRQWLARLFSQRHEAHTLIYSEGASLDGADELRVATGPAGPEIWTPHGGAFDDGTLLDPRSWHALSDTYIPPGAVPQFKMARLTVNVVVPKNSEMRVPLLVTQPLVIPPEGEDPLAALGFGGPAGNAAAMPDAWAMPDAAAAANADGLGREPLAPVPEPAPPPAVEAQPVAAMEAVRPAALSATKAAELVEVQVQLDWNQVHQRPPFWRRWRSGATAPAGAPMPSPSVAPAAPSAAVPLPEFVLPDANAEPAASPDPWGAPPDPAPWAPPPFGATLAPASSGDPWGTTAGQPAPGSLPDAAAGFADPASTARPATNNPWDHTGPAGGSPTF